MEKDPQIFLEHIHESIVAIETYAQGMTREDFSKNTAMQDAILRRIEIIGEAVKNLPEDFRNSHAEVPWRKVAGMRDVVVHEYFSIELDLVWGLLQKEVPELKRQIEALVKK